jgi:hypothetical protein
MLFITQENKNAPEISVTFPTPFSAPPAILLTPFLQDGNAPLGSIDVVVNPTTTGCDILSGNQAANFFVNILAIDPQMKIGDLQTYAGRRLNTRLGQTTINFPSALRSNDPVVLVSPEWTGQVGGVEFLYADAASEITIFSNNAAPDFYVDYFAADRGATVFDDPGSSYTLAENGTYNKLGVGLYRVYFEAPFSSPPVVFLSPWWDGSPGALGYVETLSTVTTEYFEAFSGSAASNYYVHWMAFGS